MLATNLPFVFQPFHIDDRIYLEVAAQIRLSPLFPYDYPPLFEGLISPDAASHSHLPLTSYYLALVRVLSGSRSEWVYHLAFLIFPLLAVLSFFDLAGRYLRYPLIGAALFAVSPGFLVLAHTLMTEVPLLSLWLLAVSSFLRLLDSPRPRRRDWLLCGLALAAASFLSLLSAGLVLLLLAFLLMRRRGIGNQKPQAFPVIRFLVLSIPFLVWLLWYSRAYLHYDRLVLVRSVQYLDKRASFGGEAVLLKLISFILTLGAAFVFPAFVWLGSRRRLGRLGVLPIALLTGGLLAWRFSDWEFTASILFVVFFSTGLLGLWIVCRAPSGMSSEWFLLVLWFAGILTACLFLYPSGSVRYSLLAAPPFLFLWMRGLENVRVGSGGAGRLLWLVCLVTAGYSLAIGYGDYRFASVYRDETRQVVREYGEPGRTIWFTGEWGFRYYMEEAGARVLSRTDPSPQPGDIIIKPYVAFPWVTLYDSDEYVELLEQRPVSLAFPIRLLDFGSHAGFYSTAWGLLPVGISTGERWEWFNIFRVKKKYDGPIPAPERHW